MIMKIAVGFPTPLHIEIQPVIVHNLKFSFTLISKKKFLSLGFKCFSPNLYQLVGAVVEPVYNNSGKPCHKNIAQVIVLFEHGYKIGNRQGKEFGLFGAPGC